MIKEGVGLYRYEESIVSRKCTSIKFMEINKIEQDMGWLDKNIEFKKKEEGEGGGMFLYGYTLNLKVILK